ncbi:hypothetical protein SLEP1_g39003 [Rubroshorea leprosula]|uniref:PWWP domain-containing protein n=1 Tax=Rubroshorea leprosula TaxID=152421 RepID=A0AAV5KZ66_9ROSI|nr:hypothetical protein SLEP1_g39003 [Rubroshorea leprosula]
MSVKAHQIDLNSDASLVGRENEANEVNVAETVPVVGASVDETLTGSVDGQFEVQEEMVGKGRDFERANESVDGVDGKSDLVVDVLGKRRVMECVRSGIDLLAEAGSMSEGAGDKVDGPSGGGDSLMRDNGAGRSERGRVEQDLDINVCPVVRSNSIAEDNIHVGTARDLGSLPGDFEPNSLVLGPRDSGTSTCVSKEGSFGEPENHAMEIDNQPQINKNQKWDIQSTEDVCQNDGNMANPLDLEVDLNPCTNPHDDTSGDTKSSESSDSEPDFCVSDLVWGKVRSHPWWPGQIFETSAASAKAKKYFKKDCYLIAYFGDHTFSWNEASRIKPFWSHFSNMEKQSNLGDFLYAIHCALEEVSRRIEYGLACPCITKEAYASVKTQIIVNAGIQGESSRIDGVQDRFSNATLFQPSQFIKYIKGLAQSPYYSGIGKLQFVTSQAQLLAFDRWKGYSQLPEFKILGGLLESDAEIMHSVEVKQFSRETENAFPSSKIDQVSSGDRRPESEDGSAHKRKYSGESMPSKKEKSLSDFIAERRLNIRKGKKGLGDKSGLKSIYISPGGKCESADSMSDDSVPVAKHLKGNLPDDSTPMVKHMKGNWPDDSANKLSHSKQTVTIGASILRVASQLNGSSPLFKNEDGLSQKSSAKNKDTKKPLPGKKAQGKTFSQTQNSTPDEMLSQLFLAATNPLKEYNFLTSIVSFFAEHRNSIFLESNSSEKHEQSVTVDSSWADKILQCLPEEILKADCHNQAADVLPETPNEDGVSTVELQSSVQPSANLDSEPTSTVANPEMETEKPVKPLSESSNEDSSPTALILKFTDLDSVPIVENLNKIFSRYGPLNESDTQVLKKSNRAKVVFKRPADAETAFSSAGKYSIFGPSLVSYRLKYLPSTLHKVSSGTTKRSRKKAKSGAGSST